MKVLLISSNKEEIPTPVKPIGLSRVAAALVEKNHEIKMLDLRFKNNYAEEIFSVLQNFKPDVIGISIRNIDTGCFLEPKYFIPEIKQLVNTIKIKAPSIPIMLGGAGFSLMPEEILKFCDADFGIIGEGETPFNQFLEGYENHKLLDDIPGLVYKKNGQIAFNHPILNNDLYSQKIDMRKYFDEGYFLPSYKSRTARPLTEGIQSKKGCAYSCSYCETPYVEGKKVRCYDIKSVVDNMEYIQSNYSHKIVFEFLDNIINYPPDHLEDLCNEIIHRKVDFKWMCIATPQLLTPKNAELMKKAGCLSIEFGIESFSNNILKNLNKAFTKEEAEKAISICKELEIQVLIDIMLGGPGENYETISDSFLSIEKVMPDFVLFNYGLRIFPNTTLYETAIKEGFITRDESLLFPKFYISKEIDNKAMDLIENFVRKDRARFYLCTEIWHNKLIECIESATLTWENLHSMNKE